MTNAMCNCVSALWPILLHYQQPQAHGIWGRRTSRGVSGLGLNRQGSVNAKGGHESGVAVVLGKNLEMALQKCCT